MKAYDAAFYIAAFFIVGILGASMGINVWIVLFISFILAILFLRQFRIWLILLVIVAFAGYFYYHFYFSGHTDNIVFGEITTFRGVVISEPKSSIKSQSFDIKLGDFYKGKARVYVSPYPEYDYGDYLEIKGEIVKSSSGRLNIISFPEVKILGKNTRSQIKPILFGIKERLIANLNRALSFQKSAFISGILFGERAEFSDEFEETLRKSGTTHLVALSGYNITIIAVALSGALAYIWNRRKAFLITVGFIIAFVLMTGAEKSVVRAAIMGIIFLIAQRSSRLYSFRNAITLSAGIMLLFNPTLLTSNVGFQLSFAAVLGLVYLMPALKKSLKVKVKESFLNWKENLLQTFSAQTATLPIIMFHFGYFSPLSIFANVLILGFMPLTMFFGFITAFLGLASYHLSLITGWITGILLGYEMFIINLFGNYLS